MGMQAIFGWHLAFGKPRYQWSLEVSGTYSRGIPANSSNEFTSYDDLWSRSACRGYHLPSSLVRFATTKLMRPMTYRRSSIKFCGSNSSFERWNISLAIARILQYFTMLYSLSLLSFYVRLFFFFLFFFTVGTVSSSRPSHKLFAASE